MIFWPGQLVICTEGVQADGLPSTAASQIQANSNNVQHFAGIEQEAPLSRPGICSIDRFQRIGFDRV
jgi:hypothetical protein